MEQKEVSPRLVDALDALRIEKKRETAEKFLAEALLEIDRLKKDLREANKGAERNAKTLQLNISRYKQSPIPGLKPKWKTCNIHGEENPYVWGCPECLRELRIENKKLRAQIKTLSGYGPNGLK